MTTHIRSAIDQLSLFPNRNDHNPKQDSKREGTSNITNSGHDLSAMKSIDFQRTFVIPPYHFRNQLEFFFFFFEYHQTINFITMGLACYIGNKLECKGVDLVSFMEPKVISQPFLISRLSQCYIQ